MNLKSKTFLSILMLLAGALLVGFSMGRWLAPLVAWIGPILIMRYNRDNKSWRGIPLIFIAYVLAFIIGFIGNWLGGVPLQMVPFLPILYGLLWSLPYFADKLMSTRIKDFSSTLVYPLTATTIEFVNIHTNPVGTWGMTGFTQYGNLPLMQLASVTGMIGITFLMGWFASVANWAWENRSQRKQMFRGLVIFGVVLAAVYLFGFLRLNLATTSETVRVTGITAQSLTTLSERVLEYSNPADSSGVVLSHWDAYFEQTVREAQAGAKVIIWAEGAGATDPEWGTDEVALVARAQEVARQNRIYLALPLYVRPLDKAQPYENKLLLIDPSGTIVMKHIKYGGAIMEGNRVQGNRKLQTVATPFGVLSGVICYDLDYPAIIQQAGQNGTGLLLVPSKDWLEIDPLHSHMAVFRAIENGMSIVRQTDMGLSIATDAYGRVLAQTDFFNSTDRTMVAQVPTQHVATIYTAFGRWFEWVCLIGFLAIVARAVFARRVEKE